MKSKYSDDFSKQNVLTFFRENGDFDIKNDPTKIKNLGLDDTIDFPILSLNKKVFMKRLPDGENSHNIYGDVLDEFNIPKAFSMKMAMFALYADIKHNLKKFTDVKEVMEHIFQTVPIKLDEKQYILLNKLETYTSSPGELTKYVENKNELEQSLKEKYSVYQLAELSNTSNFVVRTNSYIKKGYKDEFTQDLFGESNNTNNQLINNNMTKKEENILSNHKVETEQPLSKKEQSALIINKLNNITNKLMTADGRTDISIQDGINHFAILADQLLTISNKFNLHQLFKLTLEDKALQDLKHVKKALDMKHSNNVEKITFDDFFNEDKTPNNLTKYNLLIGNNHNVVSIIAGFKDNKKLNKLYDTYLVQDALGNTPIADYLIKDVLHTDFDNSFHKTLNSGRNMGSLVGKILNKELDDKTYEVVLDKIMQYSIPEENKKLTGYALDEFKNLFNVGIKNLQFLDDIKEKIDQTVSTNPRFGSLVLSNALDTMITHNNIDGINSVLTTIKAQAQTNPNIDSNFVKESYKKALDLPDYIVEQLKVTREDVERYGLEITKKKQSKIRSLKI